MPSLAKSHSGNEHVEVMSSSYLHIYWIVQKVSGLSLIHPVSLKASIADLVSMKKLHVRAVLLRY